MPIVCTLNLASGRSLPIGQLTTTAFKAYWSSTWPRLVVYLTLFLGSGGLVVAAPQKPAEPLSAEEQLKLLEEGESEQIEFGDALPGAKKEEPQGALPINIGGHVSARAGVSVAKSRAAKNEITEDRTRLKLVVNKNSDAAGFYGSFSLFYYGRARDNALTQNFNNETRRVLDGVYDTDTDEFQAALHQAYVNFYTRHADFRIGRQLIKWGASDSPTSTLNPNAMVSAPDQKNAFSGELEDAILGVDAIKSDIYLGVFNVEAVVIPLFQKIRFPAPGSYWGSPVDNSVFVPKTLIPLEGLVEGAEADDKLEVTRGRLEVPLNRVTINDQTPSASINNVSGGIGLKRSIFGQDLALYYFHSQERVPIAVARAKIEGNLDTATRRFVPTEVKSAYIRLKYPNTDAIGFSSSGAVWKVGYRFDVNYMLQREFLLDEFTGVRAEIVDVPDFDDGNYDGDWDVTVRQKTIFLDQLSYAFGINFGLFHNITLWVDYYGRQVMNYRADLVAVERQDIVAPRIQDSFLRETLFVRLQSLYIVQSKDALVRPELEYRFSQAAQMFVGGIVLLGKRRKARSVRDLNLGPIVNKDMVYFMGRYSF